MLIVEYRDESKIEFDPQRYEPDCVTLHSRDSPPDVAPKNRNFWFPPLPFQQHSTWTANPASVPKSHFSSLHRSPTRATQSSSIYSTSLQPELSPLARNPSTLSSISIFSHENQTWASPPNHNQQVDTAKMPLAAFIYDPPNEDRNPSGHFPESPKPHLPPPRPISKPALPPQDFWNSSLFRDAQTLPPYPLPQYPSPASPPRKSYHSAARASVNLARGSTSLVKSRCGISYEDLRKGRTDFLDDNVSLVPLTPLHDGWFEQLSADDGGGGDANDRKRNRRSQMKRRQSRTLVKLKQPSL